MHDINPHVANVISSVCSNIELSFPKGKPEFPLVTISEVYNISGVVLSSVERFSNISVQIDVWDNSQTRKLCEELAEKISSCMVRAGFRRQNATPAEEENLHRKTMTFTGMVDEKTFIVYEGG